MSDSQDQEKRRSADVAKIFDDFIEDRPYEAIPVRKVRAMMRVAWSQGYIAGLDFATAVYTTEKPK